MNALDDYLEASLPKLLGVPAGVREALKKVLLKNCRQPLPIQLEAARAILRQAAPMLASAYTESLVTAWVVGAHATAAGAELEKHNLPPEAVPTNALSADEPVMFEDLREQYTAPGFAWLKARDVMTEPTMDRQEEHVDRQAKELVSTDLAWVEETLANTLNQSLREGETVAEFTTRIDEALQSTPLADYQAETLYRTNAGRAFSAGQLQALSDPLVGSEFPYVLYSATHDSRVRPEHLAMERHGLDGTAVYRADDPVIRRFYPPWAFNCRCIAIPISREDAARYGVREAREWVESGNPPIRPEYVTPPPFDLPPGWAPLSGGQALDLVY